MKTLRYIAGVLALASALAAAPTKIGVLLKDRDLFWAAAEAGAIAAGAEAGVEVLVKAPPVPNSLPMQKALLDGLMKEPIAALVIAPLSEDAFTVQLSELKSRGVKIIALDTKLSGDLASAYLGYNQTAMAEDAGRFFANLIGETDSAAILRAYSLEGTTVREKVLQSAFKAARPKATLHADIFAGSERQDDAAKSALLLEKHPDIKAVCTPFSASTLAMTRVIQAKGLSGKVLHVGFGSMLPDEIVAAIEKGALQGWVAQQPKLIGAKGVEAAVQLVQGKTVPATIDVPYFIVTKSNLGDPAIQAIRQ